MDRRPMRLAGKWDARGGPTVPPFRVRWFFSWTELGAGRIAGFLAGYEGGAAFIEERFHARFAGTRLAEFVWNGCDRAASEPREAEPAPADTKAVCDAHFDVFSKWHDQHEWERGYLCLAAGKAGALQSVGTSLLLPAPDELTMDRIAAMARRTGILCTF